MKGNSNSRFEKLFIEGQNTEDMYLIKGFSSLIYVTRRSDIVLANNQLYSDLLAFFLSFSFLSIVSLSLIFIIIKMTESSGTHIHIVFLEIYNLGKKLVLLTKVALNSGYDISRLAT